MTTEEEFTPGETDTELLRLLDAANPLEIFSASGLPATTPQCHEIRELLAAWSMLPLSLAASQAPSQLRETLLQQAEAGAEKGPQPRRSNGGDSQEARDEGSAPHRESGLRTTMRPIWALPAAAVLVISLFGLSGWLWSRVDAQRETIASLQRRVETLSETVSGASSTLTQMKQRLALVTSPDSVVCPLRSMVPDGPAKGASGVMYVAADHQHWYLAVDGLEPCPTGKTYYLWFFVDDKPVGAGSFSAQPGKAIELGSDSMPAGTHGVGVTIEKAGAESLDAPSGPPVLLGDQMKKLA